jgi:hypothetical protein
VFRLKIAPVERGVIRRKTIRYVSVVETVNRLAYRLEVRKRAGLKIGTGAEFKTDAPTAEVRQQVRPMERDLYPVPNALEVGK